MKRTRVYYDEKYNCLWLYVGEKSVDGMLFVYTHRYTFNDAIDVIGNSGALRDKTDLVFVGYL